MAVQEADGGTQTCDMVDISSSTNATPIVVTATAHGFANGDTIHIRDHEVNTAANGRFAISAVAANTFELDGSVGNGVGGATGIATKEFFLPSAVITVPNVYVLMTELTNLANNEEIELRVFSRGRSGSTLRQVYLQSYKQSQGDALVALSPPVPAPFEFQGSIVQFADRGGTDRVFIWAIYQL